MVGCRNAAQRQRFQARTKIQRRNGVGARHLAAALQTHSTRLDSSTGSNRWLQASRCTVDDRQGLDGWQPERGTGHGARTLSTMASCSSAAVAQQACSPHARSSELQACGDNLKLPAAPARLQRHTGEPHEDVMGGWRVVHQPRSRIEVPCGTSHISSLALPRHPARWSFQWRGSRTGGRLDFDLTYGAPQPRHCRFGPRRCF